MSDSAEHPGTPRIVSFVQRSSRVKPRLQRVWDRNSSRYVLDVERDTPSTSLAQNFRIDPHKVFGRTAPLVVEIGSGRGEAITAAALACPDVDHLACEVYHPGVARTVARLSQAEVENVRIVPADAVHLVAHALPPASVTELWTFFPDPWHKTRHHKRRLVQPPFAALAARVLCDGGTWRLATDWPDYAEQFVDVLDSSEYFTGGRVARFGLRPVTRFEQKAHDEGRTVVDVAAVRTHRTPTHDAPASPPGPSARRA